MRLRLRLLPPLLGPLTVVLFGVGLIFGDLLGTSNYPPADATALVLHRYLRENAGEVRALGFFHTLAALALIAFAIHLSVLLERASPGCPGHHRAALAGGVVGGSFLFLSALCYVTLGTSAIAAWPGIAQAVLVLSYLAGGPALGAGLAILQIGVAATCLQGRLLPRWVGWFGVVAAGAGLLSLLWLLTPLDNRSPLYALLLLAALLGFVWLIVVGALLFLRRLLER